MAITAQTKLNASLVHFLDHIPGEVVHIVLVNGLGKDEEGCYVTVFAEQRKRMLILVTIAIIKRNTNQFERQDGLLAEGMG